MRVPLFTREPEASPRLVQGGDSLGFQAGPGVLLCNSWLSVGLGAHISVLKGLPFSGV